MSDKLSYEDDYSYHLLMYGENFNRFLNWTIEAYPKSNPFSIMADKELAEKLEIFFNKWKHDERCISESNKIFVSLFEENQNDV